MRKLVLHHSAGKTVKLLDNLLKILIVLFYLDLLWAAHLGIDTRHTKTSL